MIFFPDLSNNNPGIRIQPDTVAVIAKASQGVGFKDYLYARFRDQARGVGAHFIAYHWLEPGSWAAQAANAYAMVGPSTPLMIDVETGYGNANIHDILGFTNAYRALGGKVSLVYLPRWYWRGHLGSPNLVPLAIAGLSLVASDYRTFNQNLWPTPYGGVDPAIWQYTDAFPYGGGAVDFNAFRGTVEQLRQLTSPGSPPAPPPPIGELMSGKMFLVQVTGDPAVYLSNGLVRRWVHNEDDLKNLRAQASAGTMDIWHDGEIVALKSATELGSWGVLLGNSPGRQEPDLAPDPGTVDADQLAAKVADLLSERLKS